MNKFFLVLFINFIAVFQGCAMNDDLREDVKTFVKKSSWSGQIDITSIIKNHLPEGMPASNAKQYLVERGFDYTLIKKNSDENQKIVAEYKLRGFLDLFSYNEIRIIYEITTQNIIYNVVGHYIHRAL